MLKCSCCPCISTFESFNKCQSNHESHLFLLATYAYAYATVCVVSGRCYFSLFVLLYVVFESLYWCIKGILNAGESCISFFTVTILECLAESLWCIATYNYTYKIMTNEYTSLEKYTSHTLFERVTKGLCVRGELETEQTATYWPQVPLTIAALLPHSVGLLNLGSWGPSPLLGAGSHCFELQLELQLQLTPTDPTLRGTELYNCLTTTCFLWRRNCTEFNPSTIKVIPWYHRPDAHVIYIGLSLNWQLSRVSICIN